MPAKQLQRVRHRGALLGSPAGPAAGPRWGRAAGPTSGDGARRSARGQPTWCAGSRAHADAPSRRAASPAEPLVRARGARSRCAAAVQTRCSCVGAPRGPRPSGGCTWSTGRRGRSPRPAPRGRTPRSRNWTATLARPSAHSGQELLRHAGQLTQRTPLVRTPLVSRLSTLDVDHAHHGKLPSATPYSMGMLMTR